MSNPKFSKSFVWEPRRVHEPELGHGRPDSPSLPAGDEAPSAHAGPWSQPVCGTGGCPLREVTEIVC